MTTNEENKFITRNPPLQNKKRTWMFCKILRLSIMIEITNPKHKMNKLTFCTVFFYNPPFTCMVSYNDKITTLVDLIGNQTGNENLCHLFLHILSKLVALNLYLTINERSFSSFFSAYSMIL